MSRIPRMAESRRNRFFEAEGVDELMSMVLELTAELSTLRERLYVTERVLEQHGLGVGEGIEAYTLTPADAVRLEDERQRLLATVTRTLGASSRAPGESDIAREDATTTDDGSQERAA